MTILDFDRGAAERYGEIRLTLAGAGIRLADPDLRIASIAAASERLLVTGNLKRFAGVRACVPRTGFMSRSGPTPASAWPGLPPLFLRTGPAEGSI